MGIDLTPILYLALIVEVVLGILCLTGGYFLVRGVVRWVRIHSESVADEPAAPALGRGVRYSH